MVLLCVVGCLMSDVCCLLFDVGWNLVFEACRSLCAVCCLLFVDV